MANGKGEKVVYNKTDSVG